MRQNFKRAILHAPISKSLQFVKIATLTLTVVASPETSVSTPHNKLQQPIQSLRITGKVTDDSGKAIEGVSVNYIGSNVGTTTNADGHFLITIPKAGKLSISHVGFATHEITVNQSLTLDIKLRLSDASMNQIVVIGYGAVRKKEISGAVSVLPEKDFNNGVMQTAADLFQGKIAGVTVTTETGDFTAMPTIRIRGISSLSGSSDPLIVVDGVPGIDLRAVAPQDVESVTVLKDAAASAIYGSRSASGVILITTKKGHGRHSDVQLSNYIVIDKVGRKPDVLTADEWRKYTVESGMDTTSLDLGANTDWFHEIMRTGISNGHSLSVSGSTETSNYRASVNYLNREGIMRDNQIDRLNGLLSVNTSVLDNRFSIGLVGSIFETNGSPVNSFNSVLAFNMLPVYPVKNADGSWFERIESWDQGNPVHNIDANRIDVQWGQYYINGKTRLKVLKGFTIGGNFLRERSSRAVAGSESLTTQTGRITHGSAFRQDHLYNRKLMELTAEYESQFQSHNFRVLGGYSYDENRYEQAFARSEDYISDRFYYNNLAAGARLLPNDVSSYQSLTKLISFFGRLNYNFKSRYIIDASLRRDGSSKFGANNKWGMFPSVSAAWFISDEPFISSFKFINTLKLRAGYGVVGNQDGFDPYKSIALYETNDEYFENGEWKNAYRYKQNANPNLRWEEMATFNLGLDFSILSGRISGAIDYYIKETSDLLHVYNVPVPPNMFPTTLANVGDMRNKGIEVTVNTSNIETRWFSWTSSLTFARNKNKVLRLSNDAYQTESILTGTHIIEEGKEVGTFYGLQSKGIGADGKYIFVDQNKDGDINASDYTYIGHALPRLTYGFYNELSYNRIKLSFLLRGVQGNDILNTPSMTNGYIKRMPGTNVLSEALTNGLLEDPTYSSYYIEDGSFLRLDNASLSYDVNTKKIGSIKRMKVHATVQNLFIVSRFSKLDPEVTISGITPGILETFYVPRPRTFSFGIDLSF